MLMDALQLPAAMRILDKARSRASLRLEDADWSSGAALFRERNAPPERAIHNELQKFLPTLRSIKTSRHTNQTHLKQPIKLNHNMILIASTTPFSQRPAILLIRRLRHAVLPEARIAALGHYDH